MIHTEITPSEHADRLAIRELVDAKDHSAVEDQSGPLFRLTGHLDLGQYARASAIPSEMERADD